MASMNPSQAFAVLQMEGKQLAAQGKLRESLWKFEQAWKIYETPKLLKRIETLKSAIQSVSVLRKQSGSSSGSNSEEVNNNKDYSGSETICRTSSTSQDSPQETAPCLNPEEKKNAEERSYSNNSELNERDEVERKLSEVKSLYEEARELASDGKLTDALEVLEKAQSIHRTEKVQKKINAIKDYISNNRETNDLVEVSDGFFIYHKVYDALYPYQRDGVAWLWNLHRQDKGGVLADDMGLGKTFQVIAFLSGMIDANLVKHVLIVMPVSLLTNWEKEFKKWCPGIHVQDFHGSAKKLRERNLLRVQKRGHVLLTSYGIILNNADVLSKMDGREFVWDYLILDEGHKIKNATKTTRAVYDIPAKNRLLLTGTPIQNNLKELWSLFDFVHQGSLLGSLKTFKMQYEIPIVRSREKDATSGEKQLGSMMSENLKELINPYFIRRTKEEIWGNRKKINEMDELEIQMEAMQITMPKKKDFILWTFMSEQQIEIYRSFLHSNAVKEILVSKRSPLVELTVLKKICDHPRLLSQRACLQLGLDGETIYEDLLNDETSTAPSIDRVSDETLLLESGKLKLAIALIQHLIESGHRMLFFSQSLRILDMVQRILMNRKFRLLRLDGSVTKTEERERRVMKFQNNPSYPVFLLTTQVGGVGLNLTAADRVIIYDPSWNPATDAQAVDRIFRIGQNKDCVVYRLITCGSVEEKIYRRQIFKDSITRQTTGDTNPYRYFSKQELRELFSMEDPYCSVTQMQLHELHSGQRKTDQVLAEHIDFLKTLNLFGISDHDLMFTKEIQDNSEDNDEAAISKDFIQQKVATAHGLIQQEAFVAAEKMRIAGSYNFPYQLPVAMNKKSVPRGSYKPPAFPEEIDLTDSDKEAIEIALEKVNSGFMENRGSADELYITDEIKSPEVTPVYQERVQRDLTDFVSDFQDENFNDQVNASFKKSAKRISCARQSVAFASDSETPLNSEEDSCNISSASLSFVPDSTSNTPQKIAKCNLSISETPPSRPELFCGNNTSQLNSFGKKHGGNAIRITPLKIDKGRVQEDAAFVQALASSVLITPHSSPKECQGASPQYGNEKSFGELNATFVQLQSSLMEGQHGTENSLEPDESPVCLGRRKAKRQISSDSEDENDEHCALPLLDISYPKELEDECRPVSKCETLPSSAAPSSEESEDKCRAVSKHRVSPLSDSEDDECIVSPKRHVSPLLNSSDSSGSDESRALKDSSLSNGESDSIYLSGEEAPGELATDEESHSDSEGGGSSDDDHSESLFSEESVDDDN